MLAKFTKILLGLVLFGIKFATASDIEYKVISKDNHLVHLIKFDPKKHEVKLVKALDTSLAREKLSNMAERTGAIAGINGGFFHIGWPMEGKPTFNLKINGKYNSFVKREGSAIAWNNGGEIFFNTLATDIKAQLADKTVNIEKINNIVTGNSIGLFNDFFGHSTLTNFDNRKELVMDSEYKILAVNNHGDSHIPKGGHILSLPASYKISDNIIGSKLYIDYIIKKKYKDIFDWDEADNLLTGKPLLIYDGKTVFKNSGSSFFNFPYARSAIGKTKEGLILLAVVESAYSFDLKSIKTGQIIDVLSTSGFGYTDIMNMKLSRLKKTFEDKFAKDRKITGMTIPELTNFMKSQGCIYAINLDGGGSSAIFYDGKIRNRSFGDEDEALGIETERPISDGILVLK